MSNYLTTNGLKKFSLLPEAPLRPEARGICHICHMVNPALDTSVSSALSVLNDYALYKSTRSQSQIVH